MELQPIAVDKYSRGIKLDCQVLQDVCGCPGRLTPGEILPPLVYLWKQRERETIYLFVETVPWWALFLPRRRVWVLWNHEVTKTYFFLRLASRILCKTRIAHRLAPSYCASQYVGFTSALREFPRPAAGQPTQAVLHPGGQSHYKQTAAVLQAWLDHPEFPPLLVTCFGKCRASLPLSLLRQAGRAANITLYLEPLSPSHLERLQCQTPIHLCPSMAEGFGHSLNESRRAGALIITTDAEPMRHYANVLVPGLRRGLFTYVDSAAVARAVQEALSYGPVEREALGRSNQARFLADHEAFRENFAALTRSVGERGAGLAPQ